MAKDRQLLQQYGRGFHDRVNIHSSANRHASEPQNKPALKLYIYVVFLSIRNPGFFTQGYEKNVCLAAPIANF